MAIPNGNIAPTHAMSKAVSKAVMAVSKEQFRAEQLYLMSLSVAKFMLQKDIISEIDGEQMHTLSIISKIESHKTKNTVRQNLRTETVRSFELPHISQVPNR